MHRYAVRPERVEGLGPNRFLGTDGLARLSDPLVVLFDYAALIFGTSGLLAKRHAAAPLGPNPLTVTGTLRERRVATALRDSAETRLRAARRPAAYAWLMAKTLLIVQHTMTGGTLQMARAAAWGAGAAEATLGVRLLDAREAGAGDVLAADGYIFATPENLASMAGMMKDFFDRTYYAALDRLNGRPYLCLICAGSDGQGAARQIERIATGWRLKQVAPTLIVCTHAQTPEAILAPKRIGADDLKHCEDLGAGLASGLMLGVF